MEKRHEGHGGQNGILMEDEHHWYYSPAAMAVKWAVLAGILLFFFGFFVGGYLHAQRRMKKGLPPMAYHRVRRHVRVETVNELTWYQWLVPRRQRAQFEPHLWQSQNQFSFYQAQDGGYNMHPVPPPAYNPNMAAPPLYQPPTGASKVDPSQQMGTAQAPLPAPPPAATATSMPLPPTPNHA
ncbi:MAG: Vacuolar protein sorting-associated protein 8 [Watsoniomyces obsoletus]|nr:MAG: Vacuolar protein sorting-associated protein 8 [Watsoniomyces obsoletus]